MATIQLKRGAAARWSELNLVLEAGQPGLVTDENRLKIGDGVTAWNDLPYIGESNVVSAQTRNDFPPTGRVNVIYKAEAEKSIYQWNPIKLIYELLGLSEVATDDEIIDMLAQEDVLPVVVDADGGILSDEFGNILLW